MKDKRKPHTHLWEGKYGEQFELYTDSAGIQLILAHPKHATITFMNEDAEKLIDLLMEHYYGEE